MAYTRATMPNYYLHRDGANQGPYTQNDLHGMIAAGQVGRDELICPEGGTEWVPASTLAKPTAPRSTMLGHSHSHSAAVSDMEQQPVTQAQVAAAYQQLRLPALGMIASVALPVILWAAKADAERGVGVSGSREGLKSLARQNTDLLPLAIVIGAIGFALFLVWFRKARVRAKLIKASYEHQQG